MTDNDRYAMLIGVSTYDSDRYHDLPPVRADLHYMRAVLENTEIGLYNDCAMVAEPTRAEMLHAIETFLAERQPSETALLYFSGHGEFCQDDNQLYFLTRDTDPNDLPSTAVPSDFLERMLTACRASAKIVLLDCCSSGSVVQGWTAKGAAGDADQPPTGSTLLRPTGVYFITASDALQSASAMAPPGSTLGTSRFTGEIVEGLRNGHIKGGGWISPDDLFEYLTAQMVRKGVPEEQRPTKSTFRATQILYFARSVARPVHLPVLPNSDAREAVRSSPTLRKARELAALDARNGVDWEWLLRYYVHCLTAEAAAGMLPDRDREREKGYFLLGGGEEIIQSGRGSTFPAPGRLPRPRPRRDSADANGGTQHVYWYGYPAVTLPRSEGGGQGRRGAVRIAPLLIQQMELAPDEDGRDVLRPTGVPVPHAGVVSELLDEEDAADLLASWQPTWQEGNDAQMLRAVRQLLEELGLPELEPLDPSALSERTVAQTLRTGAHNAAVLLTPSSAETNFTQALVDNLLQMSTRTGQIPGTAMDALLSGGEAEADPRAVLVASGPCNESQELVVSSAMSRTLTVATGPPGTGKSEVVTAVVTTCAAAGQSVLVASTNNEAVDVVAERCDNVAPGLLMRTGNVEKQQLEAAKLDRLLDEPVEQQRRNSATVGGALRNTRALASRQRAEAGGRVGEEVRLLDLLQEREERAGALELPLPLLEGAWATGSGTAALRRWESRARNAAGAPSWRFGRWRRARALAALLRSGCASTSDGPPWPGWADERPVPPETLESLADVVAVERQLRALVHEHGDWDEEELKKSRLETAGALSELSTELSRAISAETLARARGLMGQRVQALRGERSGKRKSQRNLMAHIRGWAISTHSVGQLELVPKLFDLVVIDEASQCSIPSVLPLLFRARRALIIGDPMQLDHIATIAPEQERQARIRAGLSAAQLEDHRLTYHVHSAYHAAAQHGDTALLLDEHYRCHPEIADVVNGYCYAGQLRVLTDVRRQVPALDPVGTAEPAPVLGWVDVPGGLSARGSGDRSWRNDAEAAATRRVVDQLLARLPRDAKVGVVTPFKAQAVALARMWPDDKRVRVGTVHAFQGGQRDVMVLSPVATLNTPPRTTHWVASQVNLWNVAITRAKSQLITVGSHAFWQGQSGLPAILAGRSVLLGAGAGAFGQEAESGLTGGAPGAVHAGSVAGAFREELADRFQQYLERRGVTDLERAAVVGGHPVDLVFTTDGENTAVLIDSGPRPGQDPARHLRLAHARENLLTGLPSGGHGAKACEVSRTLRVPAWRIMAGEDRLDALFD
ncbi:AAA domain-containing protein [Streptomyces sp. NBRC 109706]|uniref:caspase, EACC1-associated type n=1 Tax=Streptomyces sp. NBRC 109706 TaxID=1550035 RepID=UPI000784595D|nr:AAA domain-containing protein [Streptomyces sp. NBRC 109706]